MRFVGKELLTVLLLGAALALRAAPPAWWEQRGVVNPGATANDYAAANLGQVKQIAKQAALEMEARLPGGAGAEINALVASWSQAPAPGVTRNDYAAVNHGQLKALAKLFYNRLAAVGCTGAPLAPGAIYPWTTDTADDASFAPANLGQVKFLFSFDLYDNDHDGLPDSWERQYFSHLAYGPTDDPGAVGRTLLESWQQNLSPWPAATVNNGLRAWYRADLGVRKDVTGKVSHWADLTGHGFGVMQTENISQQPAFLADAMNGHPTVKFVSGTTLVTSEAQDIEAGGADITIVAVVRPNAGQWYAATIFYCGNDGNSNFGLSSGWPSNQFQLIWRDADGNTRTAPPVTAAIGKVQVISAIKTGNQAAGYLDGALHGSVDIPGGMGLQPSRLAVGNSRDPYYGFDGEIAELLVYNRALSPAERQQLEAELAARYVSADEDEDGLPDAWEDQHLGTRIYGANDDPGSVGRTLLQSQQQELSPWPAATVNAGLRAWYRADLGVTKNGENRVSQWADLSGHAFHVQQTAQADFQPALVAGAMNGQPVVQYDDWHHALVTPALVDVSAGADDATIIAVVKPFASPHYAGTIFYWDTDGNWNMGLTAWGASHQYQMVWRDGDGNTRVSPGLVAAVDRVQVVSVVKDGTLASSFVNGAVAGTGEAPAGMDLHASRLAVGNSSSPYYSFHGQIAEVLVYNRALSAAERQQVEAALAARYINPDDDGDGLPDEWEDRRLGTRGYGATDDPGAVGRTLLDSFQQELSPWPSPTVDAGLRAWYRADLGVTRDADGKVSQWADLAGQGFHVEQRVDAGRQPQFVATAMNNQPAVQYDDTQKVLLTPGLTDVAGGASDATVIAVVRPDSQPHYAGTIFSWGTDGNYSLGLSSPNGTANQFSLIWRDGDGNTRLSPVLTAGAQQVQVLSAVKGGTVARAFVNGTLQGSGDVPETMALLPARLAVGNGVHPYYSFHGQIAELLVYNRALSDTERAAVEAALAAKYINPDADGDGLLDVWEDQHLGTRAYGATDNPGAVGRTLLESYQQELSPWPAPTVGNGLRAWYRADLGVVKNGDNKVSQWVDLSGQGFHVEQLADAGRQPAWVAGAMNGQSVVQYDDSQKVLLTPGLADVSDGASDATVITVVRPDSQPHYAGTIFYWGTDGNYSLGLSSPNGTANQFSLIWRDGDGNTRLSPAIHAHAQHVQVLAAIKDGATARGYLNGTLQNAGEVPETMALLPARLGVGNAAHPYYAFHGQIAEIMVYNRALSAAERAQVEAALVAKYVNPDDDGDGLPDAWEDRELGTRSYGAGDDPGRVGRTLLDSSQQSLSPWPSPTVSAGLRAWFRADLGVTKNETNNVSRWADLSGQGFHVEQLADAGRQPVLVSSAMNGQPAVQYDDTQKVLLTPGLADVSGGASDATVITVVRPDSAPHYAGTIFYWGTDGNYNFGLSSPNGTANQFSLIWRDGDGNTRLSPALTADAQQVQVLSAVKDGAAARAFVNGTLQGEGEVPAVMALLPARLGVGNGAHPYYAFHGQIAEIIVYNRALSDAERTQVEAALHERYQRLAQQIGAGGDQSLLVHYNHGVSTWGRNALGQLGDGTRADRAQPFPLGTLPRAMAATAYGEGHGLGVTLDGVLYAWGDNYFGQLGEGGLVSHPVPVAIGALNHVRQVAAGDHHSLALLANGTVWAWGGNQAGQLGDGSTASRANPVQVAGLANIVAIAAGAAHSAALAADGTVWAWGSNEFGQMGDDLSLRKTTPVAMPTLTGVTALVSGRHHFLALKADGSVLTWGANQAGQLGLGDAVSRFVPEVIPALPAVRALAAGGSHSVVLTTDGVVWTWGANESGQLGNGTTDQSSVPAANGFTGVTAVASGRDHVLALAADGAVWAWGNNERGQLGTAEIPNFSSTPVPVPADE